MTVRWLSSWSHPKISQSATVHCVAWHSDFHRNWFHTTQTSVLHINRKNWLTDMHSLYKLASCHVCHLHLVSYLTFTFARFNYRHQHSSGQSTAEPIRCSIPSAIQFSPNSSDSLTKETVCALACWLSVSSQLNPNCFFQDVNLSPLSEIQDTYSLDKSGRLEEAVDFQESYNSALFQDPNRVMPCQS